MTKEAKSDEAMQASPMPHRSRGWNHLLPTVILGLDPRIHPYGTSQPSEATHWQSA